MKDWPVFNDYSRVIGRMGMVSQRPTG